MEEDVYEQGMVSVQRLQACKECRERLGRDHEGCKGLDGLPAVDGGETLCQKVVEGLGAESHGTVEVDAGRGPEESAEKGFVVVLQKMPCELPESILIGEGFPEFRLTHHTTCRTIFGRTKTGDGAAQRLRIATGHHDAQVSAT